MNYTDASSAIRTRFETEWNDRTPAAMPNGAFDPPATTTTPWVKFTITHADADQVATGDPGNNPHRHYGMVTVEVYAAENEGDGDALELAEAALAIFRGYSIPHLRFRLAPFMRTLGNVNGAYRLNVLAPFEWDGFF